MKCDTLLLADIFENFCIKCIETYELDPPNFLSASGLACLKKMRVIIELLTHSDMLQMAEKGIRGEICHAIHRYVKATNKYMKAIIKAKNQWKQSMENVRKNKAIRLATTKEEAIWCQNQTIKQQNGFQKIY